MGWASKSERRAKSAGPCKEARLAPGGYTKGEQSNHLNRRLSPCPRSVLWTRPEEVGAITGGKLWHVFVLLTISRSFEPGWWSCSVSAIRRCAVRATSRNRGRTFARSPRARRKRLKKRNSGLSVSGSGDDAADLSRSQAGPGRGLCPPACR